MSLFKMNKSNLDFKYLEEFLTPREEQEDEISRGILEKPNKQEQDTQEYFLELFSDFFNKTKERAKEVMQEAVKEPLEPRMGGFTQLGLEAQLESMLSKQAPDMPKQKGITDAEITDIASSAIDSASDADEVQPTDGKAFDDTVKDFLELNEGNKNEPYQDTLGNWTVGIGHYIGKTLPERFKDADGNPKILADTQVQMLFEKDYKEHKEDASNLPMYDSLDNKGKQALIDLTFNMGIEVFNEDKWPKFFTALKNKDLETAAKELENSKWYDQVADRAPRVIKLIKGAKFN